jgi:hypothetical protein
LEEGDGGDSRVAAAAVLRFVGGGGGLGFV